jgi:S1-C subfamily serine protease
VAVLFGAAGGGLASRAVFSSSVEATAPSAASGSSGSASSPSTLQPPTTATPGTGSNGSGSGGSSGSGTPNGTTISSWDDVVATVSVGVVNIESLMPRGVGAGTGMALTADGEILTNNHVVQDARQIVVTVATTGQSYSASIVGTDPQEDVAVLQLQDASGLATIPLGDSDQVQVRDQVAAIGNAGGRGGTPSVATGQVVALGQQITASDEDGSNAETLQDMIRVDANVVPGDSGGPLANTDGQVIGMNTAAAVANAGGGARFGGFNGSNEGYAIPINKALQLAQELQSGAGSSGSSSSGSTSGSTPFLGVQVTTGLSGGAEVAGVQTGSPAADAGLTAGDVIVRIDRTGIETAADVVTAISDHSPGDEISITYLDSSGSSHQTTATLAGR